MRIAAVLETALQDGGAFSQSLNAIVQLKELCAGRFEFVVFTPVRENIPVLVQLGIPHERFAWSLSDTLVVRFARAPWWLRWQVRRTVTAAFERKLLAAGVDLVYFLGQSPQSAVLQQTNYMTTVFDLCHRDTPEFPEVRTFGEFERREQHLKNNLAAALMVITESDELADRLAHRYGLDRERCIGMALAPSPFLDKLDRGLGAEVLERYKLEPGYLFYPAQFWSHKNHIRILEALVLLKARNIDVSVAFAGGDRGNRRHVEEFTRKHKLSDRVHFLGFVPGDHLAQLYEGCLAVIMPTYFGPTNLPPLEAFKARKPLIYSAHLSAQVRDAAICVDPDEASSIADAIEAIGDSATRVRLVEAGVRRLEQIQKERSRAEDAVVRLLLQFDQRLKCWKQSAGAPTATE